MLYGDFLSPPRVQDSPYLLQWTIKQEGDTYRLSIGGYPFTGINDDKVIVSLDPEENVEWIVTRREFHKAYT